MELFYFFWLNHCDRISTKFGRRFWFLIEFGHNKFGHKPQSLFFFSTFCNLCYRKVGQKFGWSIFLTAFRRLQSITRIFLTKNICQKISMKFLWPIFSVTILLGKFSNRLSVSHKFRSQMNFDSIRPFFITKSVTFGNSVAISKKIGYKISLLP